MPPGPADQRLIALLERAFAHHAGDDAVIDAEKLRKALGLHSPYLAGRVLAAFDTNRDGVIQRDEFLAGVRALVFGTDREKLAFAFRVHDHDGDGALGHQDLLRMITMSLGESEVVERATQPPEQLARALFAMADSNRDGRISFDEFEGVVRRRPELLWRMTRSEATWIAPNEDLLAWLDQDGARSFRRVASAFERGWAPFLVLSGWVAAQVAIVALTLTSAADVPQQAPPVLLGRALGRCIDLDGALILVTMMRRLLTWVRASFLGRFVPTDESIGFHRVVGQTMFALAIAHSAAFAAAFAAGHAPSPVWHVVLGSRGATGAALLLVFVVMWLFSLAFIRRSSRFELFYFTHLLYVAWFVLAIVHAPSFLLWAGAPLLGFVVEQALRLRRRGPACSVLSAEALRSGVVALRIARPAGFDFGAGDYAFVRLPWVARREWHPFTISSAPERDELTFHVRSLGNWTSTLRGIVERAEPHEVGLSAYVDGPYGSPSAGIFQSRHAVLVGAGIGVTPFASVLESLILRDSGASARPSRLEKVHFFWLNRDQYSFEWFAALVAELERIDRRGLVDFHLCMTAGRPGVTALGLELAREVMRAAGRSDIVTGLRTRTHLGLPDWPEMLGAIARLHAPHAVDVFFCGPPGLATKVRRACDGLGMPFHEERF